MNIYIISIFPEIFTSFLETSLIKKGINKKIINFTLINPRDFSGNKHNQIDDEIYGGGKGMLIKAKPVIDAVEFAIDKIKIKQFRKNTLKIIFLTPSTKEFNQEVAFEYSNFKNIILVCGRYEGIDHRFVQYLETKYSKYFEKISIGKFVLLGGEVASMVIIEAVTRLIPGIIKEQISYLDESYSPEKSMNNIEYPQYTRPENVYGMQVPEILLNGNHKIILEWKNNNEQNLFI